MSSPASDGSVRKDGERMRRVATGDTGAFQQIMTEHSPRLIRLAYGITGRIDEAEDIAQDTLLSLWRGAAEWQPKATIAAYLRTVATRKAIDVIRQSNRRVDDFRMEELEDPRQDPQAAAEAEDDVALLQQHLAALPDRQRTALLLTHFENCSHRDAAAAMELDVEAFSSLLARARRALKQRMQGAQIDGGKDE